MRDSRDLVRQAAQEIEASNRTSPTPPGPARGDGSRGTEAHIEAINQVFALFRLNYHNQYYAAFPDAAQLSQIKKLWLESLADYPVEAILRGARHAIEHSEYLPTLHRMLESCRVSLGDLGLPRAEDAYLEACGAPSPRVAQRWSHPAVYLAGRDSDWFFLANRPQRETWPVFREHYEGYCTRALRGETLEIPAADTPELAPPAPLSREDQLQQLRKLREETGL